MTCVAATEECAICLEPLMPAVAGCTALPCGHTLHERCIAMLRRHGASRCPLCRREAAELQPLQPLLDEAVQAYAQRRFAAAARCLEELLEVDADHCAANGLLGVLYLQEVRCFKAQGTP